MPGFVALVLHAHLPFVRHPEHPRFLEESWLYEAITETYLPLIELLEGWRRDRLNARLTLSLSPTLCSMLMDPRLQARYEQRLNGLIELAEKEVFRTHFDPKLRPLAEAYRERFGQLRALWRGHGRDLVGAFRRLQDEGRIELIACAATHALLPLLAGSPAAMRAQVLTARDHYRACFGRDAAGIWLPECAYAPEVEPVLQEANLRWFIVDTHGLLNATPRPRYGVYAPVFTPNGLAVFGRDPESAKQVWSKNEGYPGDPRYRDFYRDIGFDLDLDYVRPYLPSPDVRGFTGIKYHRISRTGAAKEVYEPVAARLAAKGHADHFLEARREKLRRIGDAIELPPLAVAPFDAELFGHWWHEGPVFLDAFVRRVEELGGELALVTPTDYLRHHATHQVVRPSPSSWGEGGHLHVWLDEKNVWIQPHLRAAEQKLTALVQRFPQPDEFTSRVLRQMARELMLAQASDWPFILHTNTSPGYARQRVETHITRFLALSGQFEDGAVDGAKLAELEELDNLFPHVEPAYWA